ncbi:MAG TPA: FAD binding domain-containing protein [Rectinemataceae bacterium]|nr:FAD binding domain-containing protein [Rectinemataceae bacterium]
MTVGYHRPRDAAEALAILAGSDAGAGDESAGSKAAQPEAGSKPAGVAPGRPGFPRRLPLGGGTQLNSSESRDLLVEAVALEGVVPKNIEHEGSKTIIGAMTTFQEILDSPGLHPIIVAAARGMVDRNIRNRATVGGNLGSDKSCSSLIPVLLVLDAELLLLDGRRLSLEDWLELPSEPKGRGVITKITIDIKQGRLSSYARWSRVSSDLAVLGVAAAYRLEKGRVRDLRLVLGGVAAHARRVPALEAAFEGAKLPERADIEGLVAGNDGAGNPYFSPIDDARGSAAFKGFRMAALIADAIIFAKPDEAGAHSTEERA